MNNPENMKLDFNEFANGILAMKLNEALTKVQENCLDLNTPYKNKRSITAKINFSLNEARDNLDIEINVDTKLASPAPAKTHAFIGKDLRTGKIVMQEYGTQIKGQMSIDDIELNDVPADQTEVETKNEKITPMKKVAEC